MGAGTRHSPNPQYQKTKAYRMQTSVLKAGNEGRAYYKVKVSCNWCDALLSVPNTKISLWNRFDASSLMANCPACERNFTVPSAKVKKVDRDYLDQLSKSMAATQQHKSFNNYKGLEAAQRDFTWSKDEPFAMTGLSTDQQKWLAEVDASAPEPELEKQ